jgi:hypothetical protein
MQYHKWIVLTLTLLLGSWLLLDGIRAIVVGDYFTPNNGPHAGQLGPWSKIVSNLGF